MKELKTGGEKEREPSERGTGRPGNLLSRNVIEGKGKIDGRSRAGKGLNILRDKKGHGKRNLIIGKKGKVWGTN